MNTKHALSGVALLAAAVAFPAFAQRTTSISAPAARYSLLGGTTVPNGADVVSAEVGWPSAAFGIALPMTLMVSPSPVRFFIGPLFGPAVEYHVDRQLTVGLNTRFGTIINTNNNASEFGLTMQALLAWRL